MCSFIAILTSRGVCNPVIRVILGKVFVKEQGCLTVIWHVGFLILHKIKGVFLKRDGPIISNENSCVFVVLLDLL